MYVHLFFMCSHSRAAEFSDGLHCFLEQRLEGALAESVLRRPEVFVIVVTFAELFLNVIGELLDDDVGVFTKGVVVL